MLSSEVLGTAMTAEPVSCVAGRITSVWKPTRSAIAGFNGPTTDFGMYSGPNNRVGMPSFSISSRSQQRCPFFLTSLFSNR